ncbi:peptidase M16 [Litorimonas cladophorae]|uniref:Peptidase M16 n=1 Tax=Litorimonas cladophorae TaxID=1220491 RepID=A0A918KJ67_9PROT|nr:pitrilysin family protein [Litorimonas cladophorae]GGX65373.1 peptidase M16 [Litorimonas cladophorae]
MTSTLPKNLERHFRNSLLCFAAPLALIACQPASVDTAAPAKSEAALDLAFEKITLDNGLDVVFHVDRSDPVVAINLAAHVGSARETEGRTGFAHLFEHLLFLDSENLGYGGLDEMNTRIGGEGTNGFTTNDMTQYFQAVPKDALEKVIWAEADKLGWFIKTVSQDVIDNEKQVVKNEKRQRVDNAPYGHNWYAVGKALYPTDHPYNWQVIGSLEDLDAASLKDTQDFFARWYVPNNVTVTISGDFDVAEAKTLVEKYFGEIPRGQDVSAATPRPGKIDSDIKLIHEDNFATVPRLTHVWPTVEQYHPDSYALEMLSSYLTEGKTAPFNEVLVDEEKLSPGLGAFSNTSEIAGEFYLIAPSNAGTDLDALMPAIDTAFARFEETGIPQKDLDRIKAKIEVDFYGNFDSALNKAIALSEYNLFTDNPGAYKDDLAGYRGVTRDDVMRVYETYIKDKPAVITSFVPKGEPALGVEGSAKADVVEEVIVEGEGAAVEFDPAARVIENPTPSTFDRKVEPAFGAGYDLPSPTIWQTKYDNGLNVLGLASDEIPVINFTLRLDAGHLRNPITAPALAGMTADMLSKGTVNKTTAELEEAIGALGSTINISAGNTGAFVSGTTLSRNFDATMALVKEMTFEPRWDAAEFATLKNQVAQAITQSEGNPNSIARRELAELRYSSTSPLHHAGGTGYGSADALEAITLEDLKAFHAGHYTLNGATLRVAGDYTEASVESAFNLDDLGAGKTLPAVSSDLTPVGEAQIYFYDVPGAKQSVLRLSRPALAATDKDYPLAEAVNFPLGGIYTSKLNTQLRVEKGYTYGIRSGFDGSRENGTFAVSSSVRTNVTKESLELIRKILSEHGPETTEDQLAELKDALLRGQALKTETLRDKLGVLGEIDAYGYAPDYRAQNAKAIAAMTLADFKRIAATHLNPDAMQYLIVGDAATQMEPVKSLGLPVTEIE